MSPDDGAGGAIADRGPFLIGLMWPLAAISLVTVVLRLVFRCQAGKFNWSDVFMVFSMLGMFGWSICLTMLCMKGGQRHVWDVEKLGMDNLAQVQMLNWLSQVFGILGIAAGKISVSALLLTMLRLTDLRWHRIYLWIVTIGLTSVIAVSCSFLTMLQCSPPAALWDSRIQGKCVDSRVMAGYGIFTGAFNTFADGSLAVLPSTVILSLANSPTKKLQLIIVFGLNILTCICSGIKTQYLAQLANRADFTWATFDIFAWVTVEFFLMIVCGTIPTLHSLLIAIQSTTEALKNAFSRGIRGDLSDSLGDEDLGIEKRDVARGNEQVTIGRLATRKPFEGSNAQGSRSSEYLFGDLGI